MFTNPQDLEEARKKEQKAKEWRRQRGEDDESSSEDESDDGGSSGSEQDDGAVAFEKPAKPAKADVPAAATAAAGGKPAGRGGKAAAGGDSSESGSGSEEDDDDDDKDTKRKGVEGLIEVQNPNLKQPKNIKVKNLDVEAAASTSAGEKPQLSRREREEIEKQRAKAHYQKLHAAGKTDEARADLARLAIIRKQREEAERKRQEEKQGQQTTFMTLYLKFWRCPRVRLAFAEIFNWLEISASTHFCRNFSPNISMALYIFCSCQMLRPNQKPCPPMDDRTAEIGSTVVLHKRPWLVSFERKQSRPCLPPNSKLDQS